MIRLIFPHPLVEDGREHATYDIENGRMTVYLPKEETGRLEVPPITSQGKFFSDLDMLSKLMFPSKKEAPSIAMVDRPNLEEGEYKL